MVPPASDRDMLNRILDNQEHSQRQMAVMQSSVAVLIDDRARAAEERRETRKQIQGVQERLVTVERAVDTNTILTAGIQQDVAEMKNDQDTVKTTLENYQRKEQRVLGWMDAARRVGFVGWTIICGIGAGAIGLLFYWLQRFL